MNETSIEKALMDIIFGQKMIMKSGLKNTFEIPSCASHFFSDSLISKGWVNKDL